jgi:uncharacterized protein (TIGR02145 family)
MKNEIQIGTQIWMTTNIDVEHFRNGDPIPEVRDEDEWVAAGEAGKPAWCFYDNDPANGEKYGKLYNLYAVNDPRGLAPEGWHIPSNAECEILADFLGGEESAGAKMKSTYGWVHNGNGNNESGFSGLPGGYRDAKGSFCFIEEFGFWWGSPEYDSGDAWSATLSYTFSRLDLEYPGRESGFSVRCLRD